MDSKGFANHGVEDGEVLEGVVGQRLEGTISISEMFDLFVVELLTDTGIASIYIE